LSNIRSRSTARWSLPCSPESASGSGGRLTFGRGFAVGILITLISSTCYVGTWEILYFKFTPDYNIALTFMEGFPIGLVVTAVSAGILRKKPRAAEG
jgi:hypothetical protein